MTGNNNSGIILQPRDLTLLRELATMRLIDREQAKVVASFGSTTRANTRLLKLTRAGLLQRFFTGSDALGRKAVYALSRDGAALVNAPFRVLVRKPDATLAGDRFLHHQQGINCIYLAVKFPSAPEARLFLNRWSVFYQPLSPAIALTPDAYFEVNAPVGLRPMFLEVDLGTETLKVWQGKVKSYLDLALTGEFKRLFLQDQFRVLVVVRSDRRLSGIRSVVSRMTEKLFWFTTLEAVQREGLWSHVWLRPRNDQRHSLL